MARTNSLSYLRGEKEINPNKPVNNIPKSLRHLFALNLRLDEVKEISFRRTSKR